MKKIPTLFERDWQDNPSRVTQDVHPGCEWVLADEGTPTRKYDGTCCMVRDFKLFKRREVKKDQDIPASFELVEIDKETGNSVGWIPVGDGPEDRYHREALSYRPFAPDGTYELIGPKIQGGIENDSMPRHMIVPHGWMILDLYPYHPLTFDSIRSYLEKMDIEGIVWHHSDGRMAKIKKKDFGLKRKPESTTK